MICMYDKTMKLVAKRSQTIARRQRRHTHEHTGTSTSSSKHAYAIERLIFPDFLVRRSSSSSPSPPSSVVTVSFETRLEHCLALRDDNVHQNIPILIYWPTKKKKEKKNSFDSSTNPNRSGPISNLSIDDGMCIHFTSASMRVCVILIVNKMFRWFWWIEIICKCRIKSILKRMYAYEYIRVLR